jgi:hypothetical protein
VAVSRYVINPYSFAPWYVMNPYSFGWWSSRFKKKRTPIGIL